MAYYAEGTKKELLAVRDSIRDWVLSEQWVRGTAKPLVERWIKFLRVEREDARKLGNGVRDDAYIENWRFFPYAYVNVDYLQRLSKAEMDLRAEVYDDINRLVRYFDQWDSDRQEPGVRGGVNPNTLLAANTQINLIRAKYASEAASLEKAIVDAQQSVIDRAIFEAAKEVGRVSESGTWDSNARAIVTAITGNYVAAAGLGLLGVGILAYFFIGSKKR